MDRKEFLSQIGLGAAGMILFGCLGGCEKKDDAPAAPTNVNITLDLTASANAPLLTAGGYIYTNGIIVAQTTSGTYLAVAQACTHEGYTVEFDSASTRFHCKLHNSWFTSTGSVVSGQARSALTQYTVTKTGNTLTIKS